MKKIVAILCFLLAGSCCFAQVPEEVTAEYELAAGACVAWTGVLCNGVQLHDWTGEVCRASWDIAGSRPGRYEVRVLYSSAEEVSPILDLVCGEQTVRCRTLSGTGALSRYRMGTLGEITLRASDRLLSLVRAGTATSLLNIRMIYLREQPAGGTEPVLPKGEKTWAE